MGTENLIIYGVIAVAVIALAIVLINIYVKAPPSYAFILSGIRKEPRVMIGTGGFKIPFLERLDKVFLGQVSVDVKTSIPVPTHDFIDVMVDAVCKVRALPNQEGTRLAAKNFLNMSPQQIASEIKDSLEGNMREVVGAITLQNLITDRDKFSDEIQSKAARDMAKLGLEVISCNIQNITDQNQLIENLGADNTYAIRKNAAITKANAEKDIAVAESRAKKDANDVRVQAETEIAERNNELAIKQAELKIASDTKQADADAAYAIQQQEQQKTINTKTVDAQIEQTKREQILSQEKIQIKKNELTAEINAQADADKYKKTIDSDANKYQTEINAQAKLEQQKREAEAKAYLAEQEALAIKAKADADKYAALQEAAGIEAKGKAEAVAKQAGLEAEAAGILAKGEAEAKAMQKKAEAYEKYGKVAVIDILTKMTEKVMPEVAKNIAEPMSKIGDIKIYGTTGTEASGIASNVPAVIKQTFDTMKDVTGVDMADIMKASTIDAKVDRNINISGDEKKEVGVNVNTK
jgi:flotillin